MSDQNNKTPVRYVKSYVKEENTPIGVVLNCSIDPVDFNKLPINSKWMVEISIRRKKKVDQYGNTHTIILNTRKNKWSSSNNNTVSVSNNGNVTIK